MFKSKRYVTRGVDADIDIEIQLVLWEMLDNLIKSGIPPDYLQIFRLKKVDIDNISYQQIIHTQEVSIYKKKILISFSSLSIDEKVYIIDSGEAVTMLLASEY